MSSQNSNHRRHELMPLGASRKRKDMDVFDAHRGPVTTKCEPAPPPSAQRQLAQQPTQPSVGGNRLLAGYLAHEFITKGTLFGQRWDPSKPPGPARHQPDCKEPQPPLLLKPQLQPAQVQAQPKPKQPAAPEPKQGKQQPAAYAELAYLLKTDGAHIPGIVNPTQLARLLRM